MSWIRLCLNIILGVLVLSTSCTFDSDSSDEMPFQLTTESSGDELILDDIDEFIVTGDRISEQVLQAACQNYRDWLEDIALDPDVVILDDPSLLRSAELLAGEYSADPVATAIEELLIETGSEQEALRLLDVDGISESDLDTARRYLRERHDEPSATARERFVVYLSNATPSIRRLTRLAVTPPVRVVAPSMTRIRDIRVLTEAGSLLGVSEELCWK